MPYCSSNLVLFFYSKISKWLYMLLIIMSNDIHQNPGPPFFTFMSWNANSIAKGDFQRVSCLIEAHNSIFNYDIISICETSFNDSVAIPDSLLNGYTFVSSNYPANTRHDGRVFSINILYPLRSERIFRLINQ